MKPFERRRILNHATTDIADVMAGLDDFQRKISELAGAYPSSSGNASTGSTTTLHCFEHQEDDCPCGHSVSVATRSDPTGRAAANADPASKAETEFDRLLNQLTTTAAALRRTVTEWTTVTKLMPASEGEPGCEVVGRLKSPSTNRPYYEPAIVYTDGKGNLKRKMHLSRWAYDHVLKTGVVPNEEETVDHVNGRRIKCRHGRTTSSKRRAS